MTPSSSAGDLDLGDLEKALITISSGPTLPLNETVQSLRLLADASRHDEEIRKRLGETKSLQGLTAIVGYGNDNPHEVVDAALRCIGNACIDNDTARENVTAIGFEWAERRLKCGFYGELATADLTIKALYNICLDYEPAQQQCFRDDIHAGLVFLCEAHPDSELEAYPLLFQLLFWICSHREALKDAAPLDGHGTHESAIVTTLLRLPAMYKELLEPDEWAMLYETCLVYLRDTEVQQGVVQRNEASEVWKLLVCNEEFVDPYPQARDVEDVKLLIPISTSLIWILSDVAALPEFAKHNTVRSSWIESNVVQWIEVGPGSSNNRLYTAACQVLGNVLWATKAPEDFSYLVDERGLHDALLRNMNRLDAELLHASAGVVLQLARPSVELRERIASSKWAEVMLEHLCRHENPQIQQDGMRLLRALGQTNAAIQTRFAELAREVVANASAGAEAADADTSMAETPG
ncbi:hypothetical protein LTR09_008523 [Extremus antarcticus]|uniref:Uncharacterized protein n=1 Tax=Extremus antarcticus TaxID=702011 RepID=A0AAJ0DH45_9PEZI|nr:hypothetical protein LTR09_008523 [Extremus antarcticus]